MNLTPIEWTDFSSNALKYRNADGEVVWGCVHASTGCTNCYSEKLAKRYGRGGPFNVQTMNGLTPFLDEREMRHMLTAKTVGKKPVAGSRCFVGDMTDVFGPWVPDALLDRLFAVFALRPDVTWQVLTKRADRMRDYLVSRSKSAQFWKDAARQLGYALEWQGLSLVPFPLPNVWCGISCENQQMYDKRIGDLLRTPAAVRFLSCEPLLGPIDLRLGGMSMPDYSAHDPLPQPDWIIIGGESGPQARPMDVAWFRSIVQQGQAAGVAVFGKQLGSNPVVDESDLMPEHSADVDPADLAAYAKNFAEMPVRLRHRKGGDPEEWSPELRVREFPVSPHDPTRKAGA